MECLACHAPNIDGARFCAKCGAPLPVQKAADADPLIGKTIGGRYRVVGILGEGGMGRVYNAEQQMGTSVRKVAVKTLLAQFAKDPQTVARFMREVGTVSELEHPNTIKVYDFGQIEGSGELYIAMELLQGKSLDDELSTGQPMAPERVDRILGQVCGSLQEAHDKGIVHRDLKPANIYLTTRAGEEDVVKVLDFGIAKRDSKDSKHEQKLTQQGTILGTPPYMSPEQFTGKELDARSDIYSLGVVAFEMLTGRLPFEADTPWQWMTAHMQEPPRPFESIPAAANVPPKMRQAVLRALAKDLAHRPQSARDLYEDLTIGAARMSAVGLGVGGVGSIPGGAVSSGTQMLTNQSPVTGRAGGTQIGEPLFPPGGGAPTAGKTVIGQELGAPAMPMGVAPGYPAAPPQRAQKGGGGGMIALAAVLFLLIGAGVGGFFYFKNKPSDADADGGSIELPKSAKPKTEDTSSASTSSAPTATTSAAPTSEPPDAGPANSGTPDAGPEPSATATATATAVASGDPGPKPTTTANATSKPQPQQGIDGCCTKYRTDPTKRTLCNGMNAKIKSGAVDRSRALGTLHGQGIHCN